MNAIAVENGKTHCDVLRRVHSIKEYKELLLKIYMTAKEVAPLLHLCGCFFPC